MFQAEVMVSAIKAEQNSNAHSSHENRNLIDEVMDHSKKSWNHVLSGHSTLADKAVVGTEIIVGAAASVAAAVVLRKCLPAAETFFPEATAKLEKSNWITPMEAWKDTF